jgi:hypothetical protein
MWLTWRKTIVLCSHNIVQYFLIEYENAVEPDFVFCIAMAANHSKHIHPGLDAFILAFRRVRLIWSMKHPVKEQQLFDDRSSMDGPQHVEV